MERNFDSAAESATGGNCLESPPANFTGQAATILRFSTRILLSICARSVRGSDTILTWMDRSRQRGALDRLSDHMLKDIGVSRADVDLETRKPFWHD
ncbi:MAG TPA: DUF1127 domain-containing protein [Dongiaceae bacterium]